MSRDYLQGFFTPKNPKKYSGRDRPVFRSSYELKFMKWLDESPSVISWNSESVVVPYVSPIDGKFHRYFIDMIVEMQTSYGIKKYLIEIKPESQTKPPKEPKRKTKSYIEQVMTYGVNESKWQAAKKYAQERGWEFKVLTENDLAINNKYR